MSNYYERIYKRIHEAIPYDFEHEIKTTNELGLTEVYRLKDIYFIRIQNFWGSDEFMVKYKGCDVPFDEDHHANVLFYECENRTHYFSLSPEEITELLGEL